MPDFHRLRKTRTTEMNSKELNERLRAEAARSARNNNNKQRKAALENSRRQQRISEQTKKQLPPQSPARRQREEEMRRRAQQELRERKKRRRKRGSNVVYYVALGLIALGIFAILSITVLFNTERIIVVGDSDYTAEEIIAASELKGDENLVRLNLSGTAEKILNKLVCLDRVRVEKSYPSAIRITVTGSVPMATFHYNGKNYVISHSGRVMRIEDEDEPCMKVLGYVPAESVIVGSFVYAKDEHQDELIAQLSAAIEAGGLTEQITTVDITDPIGLKMTYEDRIEVYLGSILSIDQKITALNELMNGGYITATEKITLDLSDPSRGITRPITTTAPPQPPETLEITDENGDTTGDITGEVT